MILQLINSIKLLRISRLLRGLKFMNIIIKVIYKSISAFIYISLLLFLIIFIYGLLGMQLFQNLGEGGISHPFYHIYNFETFLESFFTVFSVITLDNWNYVMQIIVKSQNINPFLPGIYLISAIFIGNYIFLNLFLAILLDGFTDDVLSTKVKENNFVFPSISDEEFEKEEQQEEFSKIPIDTSSTIIVRKSKKGDIISNFMIKKKKSNFFKQDFNKQINKIVHYLKIAFIKIKLLCCFILSKPLFEKTIITIVILTSFKLIFDTYIDFDDPNQIEIQKTSEIIDILLNSFFVFEALIKIIALDPFKYFKDPLNQLDFFIASFSIVDFVVSNLNLPAIKV